MAQRTVLVVEDEPGLAELFRLNLEAAGYHVLVAEDGRSGLDLFRTSHPALVTLDLKLPEVSGFRLIKLFKQPPDAVPVIVVTALDYTEAEEVVRAGADDFLTKPFEPATLVERVRFHLGD